MPKNHIYSEEIRRFEREIIDFIVESGKNKRSSDIESHILAYFFCHPSLTQKQIQELSAIFREKKISKGSISNFLNQYERYGVIVKNKIPEKRNAFKYTLKYRNIKDLMSTGLETGLGEIQKWIEYTEARLQALTKIKPETSQIELHTILVERLKELRDFLLFHNNLMKNFLSGKFNITEKPEIKISDEIIDEIIKKSILIIEEEIVNFIQKNPLFMIDEVKYLPIFSYLITRKRMTQSKLQKLTGLSSGLISEGLDHLLKKNFIELEKIKGRRKRFYVMSSIGYSNYLKQYQRFKLINGFKIKIEQIYQEMKKREQELKKLNGYEIILEWAKEALKLFVIVEDGIKIFEKALNRFKSLKNKATI
ncbi:MAG: hypothetical protein HWN67_06140 [Candidatus Helarchaeota archaeon]|nr:hypothetical protein [Candidatus Helarchaeota archaeon]